MLLSYVSSKYTEIGGKILHWTKSCPPRNSGSRVSQLQVQVDPSGPHSAVDPLFVDVLRKETRDFFVVSWVSGSQMTHLHFPL